MKTWSAICVLFLVGTGGCAGVPGSPSTTPLPSPTRANYLLDQQSERDGRFVGLAISGGGSRAAVFGGAVLKELERAGLLQQVDVLSAVSGGALPAAYYALDGFRTVDFANGFLERMGHNFQRDVLNSWVSPGNVLKYWFTAATRSDTVIRILDEDLFHGATFADLNQARPKLLLNATNALTGDPFVISDESFAALASSLSSFSVARAVYMSAAYPGVFDPVPLRNGTHPTESDSRPAVLAYDGGPVDNLGVKTLVNLLGKADRQEALAARFPNGCLVISVDATPRIAIENDQPLSASTVLLTSNRREVLERVGIAADRQDLAMFGRFTLNESRCTFWHLALRQLTDDTPLGVKVTRIETNLGLEPEDQQLLIQAAQRLVDQGLKKARREVIDPPFLRDAGDAATISR